MRWTYLAAAFVACGFSVSAAHAAWDVAADYSTTSNPSGAWRYGRASTVGSAAIDLLTVRWGTSGWYMGNVGHGGPSVQAGVLLWAKNNTNGYPVIRWTAPAAGSYCVAVKFTGADSRGGDNHVYVVKNGTTVFSGRVVQYLQELSYEAIGPHAFDLAEGDHIDFTAVWGGTVNSEYGWVGLTGFIAPAQDCPTLAVSPADWGRVKQRFR